MDDETLPALFQPADQDPLTLLSSPLSSDGDISDTAYASPLSSSGISDALANSPQQQQSTHPSSSSVFINSNDLTSLTTISDDTLESLLLQQNTMSDDIKLDLGSCSVLN